MMTVFQFFEWFGAAVLLAHGVRNLRYACRETDPKMLGGNIAMTLGAFGVAVPPILVQDVPPMARAALVMGVAILFVFGRRPDDKGHGRPSRSTLIERG